MNYSEERKALVDKVVNMYLEKFPLTPKYGITLISSEDDSEGTYYFEMSDEEMQVLKAWKNDKEELDLHEYLEICAANDESGKYSAMMERWLKNNSFFELNILKSCDLDNPRFFTKVKIHFLNDEDELLSIPQYDVSVTLDDMKSLLSLFILKSNHVTCNQLVYHNPIFSAKMMHDLSWSIEQWAYEFPFPFIVEMTEIKQIVENICFPEKDVLGLDSMQDEQIKLFWNDFQIVPYYVELCMEYKEDGAFHINSYIKGHTLEILQEESVDSTNNLQSESQSYNADILCKKLGLSSYQALQDYMYEHYSVKTAFADFKAWAEQNCKECIL